MRIQYKNFLLSSVILFCFSQNAQAQNKIELDAKDLQIDSIEAPAIDLDYQKLIEEEVSKEDSEMTFDELKDFLAIRTESNE